MGSFRGGKRGGSRTAHLKGPASDAPQPCSDLPHARANALRANPGSRSHAAAADPTSNAQSAAHDSTTDWADDSDAIISDSSEAEAEEEGQDTDQQGPSADHGSAADEDDLKFEVDVVDTLGDLSQAMSPAKSTGIPGHDKVANCSFAVLLCSLLTPCGCCRASRQDFDWCCRLQCSTLCLPFLPAHFSLPPHGNIMQPSFDVAIPHDP